VSLLPRVKRYIAGQDEHHKNETFRQEYRRFLRKHGLTWAEQYV
jgi:putative transposase